MRRALLLLVTATCLLAFAGPALAGGGSYVVTGGTTKEQATVRAALEASRFDWSLIPHSITIHVVPIGDSYSTYGDVYVGASLLESGRFSWGVVQHEMAHQVDFFLLDDAKRTQLQQLLGGKDWCYTMPGLAHAEHGCERFASELAWAYWPSPDNSMRPVAPGDEAGFAPVAKFEALLTQLIGAPVATQPSATKAFAPTPKKKRR
jgi:hypothetical protein